MITHDEVRLHINQAKTLCSIVSRDGTNLDLTAREYDVTSADTIALAGAMLTGNVGSDEEARSFLLYRECPQCHVGYVPCRECETLPKNERRQVCRVCPECGSHAPSQLNPS